TSAEKAPIRATYLVEKAMALYKVKKDPKELESDASTALGIDEKNYLPHYLMAQYFHYVGIMRPELRQSNYDKAVHEYKDAIDKATNDKKHPSFNHPSRKNHLAYMWYGLAGIYNSFAASATNPTDKEENAKKAAICYERLAELEGVNDAAILAGRGRYWED